MMYIKYIINDFLLNSEFIFNVEYINNLYKGFNFLWPKIDLAVNFNISFHHFHFSYSVFEIFVIE